MSLLPEPTLTALASGADRADRVADWPAASWDAVRQAGMLAWGVPAAHGGLGLAPAQLTNRQVALGAACLTTAFILSQREAALRLLVRFADRDVARRLLPGLATGERFLTVGVSQLTTSRQHRGPALLAVPTATGYRLDGEAPWVTAADQADALVLGATLADGRQALFVVPTDRPGLHIGPPLPLAALHGSRTTSVRCEGVELSADWLLAGPVEQVLGSTAGGGLDTSALALALATASVRWLDDEATRRPDLLPIANGFTHERAGVHRLLLELSELPPQRDRLLALRVRATRLALRATQAALVIAKGAGFVTTHPVQRWARQALFFLVWSCPRPAAEGILGDLLYTPVEEDPLSCDIDGTP